MAELSELLVWLAQGHPAVATYFLGVSILRHVFKPTFSLIEYLTKESENKTDDVILSKVQKSLPYKALSFILDVTTSIKIDTLIKK